MLYHSAAASEVPSVQERKAAEKVKRDAKLNGNAHEMARYDKGSMLLNLIMSKKGDSSSQQVCSILHEDAWHTSK